MKYILGIESTAHTFGVAVLDWDGKILSNVRDMYTTEKGGMIPLEVRKHHERVAGELFERALDESGVKREELVAVAFSNAPGLAPCLLEGMKFAKQTAKGLDVPVVSVNHCVAHLEIGESVGAKDPVMLYASGANTQVIAYEAGKYRVFGETLDLGVGNFIDTIARYMGLGFPGGPKIEKLAEKCKNKDVLIELPYSIKGMDVAFSGLQTKIRNLIDKAPSFEKRGSLESENHILNVERSTSGRSDTSQNITSSCRPEDTCTRSFQTSHEYLNQLAYSLQEVVFAMLVEAAERALAHTGKKELLLGGGVACNSRLQEMCKIMCEERGCKLFVPDRSLLVDNAGMIGYLGLKMHKKGLGIRDLGLVDIAPRERTDDVEVSW